VRASARLLVTAALVGLPITPATAADPLQVDSWIARCPDPDRLLADAAAVEALNRRILSAGPSLTDLERLPTTLDRTEVLRRIGSRSELPALPLDFATGGAVDDHDRQGFRDALAVGDVPPVVEPRFGVVVRRAAVRRFPTRQRVIARGGADDIDQLQESAFFPGTAVAAVHSSADGAWQFVIGQSYDGWVEREAVAFGGRDEVLGYASRSSRVVTGARATTVFTPNLPAASRIVLDMGSSLPERRDWPIATPVNGQSAAGGVVVELPLREADGRLRVVPALIPRSADTSDGPLPATRANLLRQAFKFLGERYGWGHDFDGRDCSGFVRDVYASLGIVLPRNTRDQASCPALEGTPLAADCPPDRRLQAVKALFPGDLVFTGRHVMIVIGHVEGEPWVIHDTHGSRPDGGIHNGVVVQPFRSVDDGAAADRVTACVRVLTLTTAARP